jgi:hemoglobin/transferrin/lactoferrin receptor protein
LIIHPKAGIYARLSPSPIACAYGGNNIIHSKPIDMKKLFLVAVFQLLILSLTSLGQSVVLRDKSSRLAISDAAIRGNKTSETLLSNAKGEADLNSLAESDTLTFSHVGYYTLSVPKSRLTTSEVYLVERAYDMEEVVVSASKFEEKKKDVPQQVQVIQAKELQFVNQQTTADVLTQSGNILVQKSQMGGGSPIIRGFEANKVLLVVDGVRMNNAIYRAGHLQNAITLDNNMLDKTEIVFGPGSVVYGSDALGGVMHFYTKKPLLADSAGKTLVKANAFMRYSSANTEKTGHVDFNIGLKKFAFLTSFTASDFGDLRTGSNRNPFYGDWGKSTQYVERINGKDSVIKNPDVEVQRQSNYKQYDVMQKVLFQQNKRISHLLNIQYSTSSNISRYDRLSETSKGLPRSAQWYYGPQKRLFGSYTLSIVGLGKLADQARVILAVQDIEESRHSRNLNSSTLNHRIEHVNVYSVNLDLSKNMASHELRYGAELTHNIINSTANKENIKTGEKTPLDTRYPDGGSTMTTAAAYLTHTWEITPKIVLSDGLRYSYISLVSKFNDKTFFPFPYDKVEQKNLALNGNIGLVFLPTKSWKVSVLGSSGFRAPNLDDMGKVFEQSGGGSVMVPNPNLKPEYTYNAELGITKGINNTTWIQLNSYYIWYTNAITTRRSTFGGNDSIIYNNTKSRVVTLTNANDAYIYGLSASVQSDVTEQFALTGSINYTYGRIKTDTTDYPLDHIAPIFGKVGAMWKLKKVKSEFYVLYNGWKRLSEYNTMGEDNIAYATVYGTPAWMTFNLRCAYQVNQYLQVQAAVENILDQHYRVFASGISAPGRNFVVTVRGSF